MRGFAQHLYTLINFSDLRECLGMFTWRRHLRCVIVQQTLQFTPLVLELSLIQSHLLWGEFSACSAADALHNFSNFHSTRYPSLLGGQRRHDMRGFAQHLYTLINFSDLRELVNCPCATIGVGDCEANQSSWHEAFVLQECLLGGAT